MNEAHTTAVSGRRIPSERVQTLDGNHVDTGSFGNDGKPFLIVIWAAWSKHCIAELDAVAAQYSAWVAAFGVKVYAVSCDDASAACNVVDIVATHDWPFAVYLDPDQDFRRALGVNLPPQLWIADGSGALVYQHADYAPGDEQLWGEMLKRIAAVA